MKKRKKMKRYKTAVCIFLKEKRKKKKSKYKSLADGLKRKRKNLT